MRVDPAQFGADREAIRLHLEADGIESRPVWKPMHLQPAWSRCLHDGGHVAQAIFDDGLCLPSGSAMTDEDLDRVVLRFRSVPRYASV